MKKLLALSLAFLTTACASTNRNLASDGEPDTAAVELATKLNGGSVKFVANREGGIASIVTFFDLNFKNCRALGTAGYSPTTEQGFRLASVECDVELNTDPVRTSFRAQISGDKRNFTIRAAHEEANKYSLDAELTVSYEQKRWVGKGKVNGWVNQKVGKNTTITATVKETLSF